MPKMDFHAVRCDQCGKTFTALSPQSKYCSSACRSTAYRQRKRHESREPIRGLSGHAAIMFIDMAGCSEPAARLIKAIRDKRGLAAARDAVFVAAAALWPGVEDRSSAYYEFFVSDLPEYLKDVL